MAEPKGPKGKTLPKYTKSEGGPTVFSKFIEKKEEMGQLYARIEMEKFKKFKLLCDKENISMAQGATIALDLLFDFYEKQTAKKLK